MAKNHRQPKSFPFVETEIFILENSVFPDQEETSRCQNAIRGWKKFIIPYTPASGENCSPCDSTLEYVSLILAGMAFDSCTAKPTTLALVPKLALLWPTIWTWLQIFHTHNTQARSRLLATHEADTHRGWYALVIATLRCFTSHNPPNKLSVLVKETDGVLAMMATLWIEEGRDLGVVFGFQAADLHVPYVTSNLLEHIITGCGGGANEAVDLSFRRIRKNLKQANPDYSCVGKDLMLCLGQLRDGSAILNRAYLSHPASIAIMVDILALLLASPAPMPGLLQLPTLCINLHMYMSRTYEAVSQLLDTPFLSILHRLSPMRGLSRELKETCDMLLRVIIPRYSIYPSLLSGIHRGLVAIEKQVKTLPSGPLGECLLALDTNIRPRAQSYADYKQGTRAVFNCGNPECRVIESSSNFPRCSGCILTCYCSRTCQRVHWRGTHKTLCRNMRLPGRKCVAISGPYLRFLAHVIVCDFFDLGSQVVPFLRRSSPESPSLMLVLDYDCPNGVKIFQVDYNNPSALATFSRRLPQSHMLQDVWQGAWSSSCYSESTESLMITAVPIIVLVPRDWGVPQVMVALLTADISLAASPKEAQIRWLYCK